MRTNFVLDTNVLLHDPKAVFHFGDDDVVIPIEVMEEIDKFKHDASELGRSSRTVARIIDGLRSLGNLGEGVPLEGSGSLRIACTRRSASPDRASSSNGKDRVPDSILTTAEWLQSEFPARETVIVTKNVNLRVKADALGITARDYDTDRSPDTEQQPGWRHIDSTADMLEQVKQGERVNLDGLICTPNEYIFLKDPDNRENSYPCRADADGATLIPMTPIKNDIAGIRALNLEQAFALDALLNDDIPLVELIGKAGTGKTLLGIAAGLHKVFVESHYTRLLVFRPTMPISRDLGFLPGDIEEKMRPWMQPVYDALELIRNRTGRGPDRALPPDLTECEEISVEPLTYIRGRSIPNQFIIIDEAQNLTPLEVKTVITRVGNGTKIVFTGDPHQIDNPYVDSLSNGLTYLVSKFRNSKLAAHINLVKGERSRLAETAADLL